jgi:excisionase family DNA binding protein
MKIYTTGEVSKIIGISTATVRNEIERGNLIAFKVGTDYRITQERLDEYMGLDRSWEKEKERLLKKIEAQQVIINKFKAMAKEMLEVSYED